MNRYRRVWVVYRKELIETLRDRRTLIAMVVVPIVLYPLLMVILVEALKTETTRRQEEHYSICVPTEQHRQWLSAVLEREEAERQTAESARHDAAQAAGEPTEDVGDEFRAYLRPPQVSIVVVGQTQSLWDLVSSRVYHTGLILDPPPAPDVSADATNRIAQIIYCDTDPRSEFVADQLDRILSLEAQRVVKARLAELPGGENILTPIVTNALSTASPAKQFAKILAMVVPFLLVTMTVTGALYPAIDLTAGERERGTLETLAVSPVPTGQIVAGKFGVIVTIALLSTTLNLGSMTAMIHFVKLDQLAASAQPSHREEARAVEQLIEQSRPPSATTESLAASEPAPAPPSPDAEPDQTRDRDGAVPSQHAVPSHYRQAAAPSSQARSATTTPAAPTAYSQWHYLQERRELEQQSAQKAGFLTTAAPIVLLAMMPFAVLFGGIMLAVCSFARTFKEAQNYMMPVMMAAIVPAMVVSYMPTIELKGAMLVLPVANVVVLMRDLFLGQYDLPAMAVCFLSSCLYAAAAVAVAARVYGHEAVLFSDVGAYKTLLRRRFIRPHDSPSTAFALLTVALLFPINFYWQSYLIDAQSSGAWLRLVVAAAQVLIFVLPAVLLCWYFKIDVPETFRLRAPRPLPLLGTLLMAVSIVPVSNLLLQVQFTVFEPGAMPDNLPEPLKRGFTEGSLAGILLLLAIIPAICEELLFRGFLMSGLRRRLSTPMLVFVVGLIFALYHLSSEKIPLVTLLGILLAYVCLRSGSILPAMLLHAANNGLILASVRIDALRTFFGLPAPDAQLPVLQFDARLIIFLAVFVLGLALTAKPRPTRAPSS